MSKLLYPALLTAHLFFVLSCSTGSLKTDSKGQSGYVQKGNSSFKLHPFREKVLENGLKIIFIRDESLPRVSLTMMIKAGNMNEPESKAGLNALTSYLLEQGTQARSAIEFADALGQIGTSLEVSPGNDTTTIYSDSLKTSSSDLLNLFSDAVINPAFKESEISRIRSQMIASLQKKVDNPSSFAESEIDQYLFGKHPYGREIDGKKETLKGIRKQDIIKHYLTFFRPNNSVLAVVGAFDDLFEKSVEDTFGKWSKRSIPALAVEPPPAIDGLKVKLVVKSGLQQAQVRISALGIARSNEDFLKLRLSNEVLGGSFASRLNQKIRTELGLTYSIYSNFAVMKERGSFDISTFTKNETAEIMVDQTLKVLSDFVAQGPVERELEAARNQLIGQFPRAIETADRLAYNLLALDFYGISYDYLLDYNKNIENISLKDAAKAMRIAVDPTKLKVLVYGDEKIIPQFEKYKPEIIRIK